MIAILLATKLGHTDDGSPLTYQDWMGAMSYVSCLSNTTLFVWIFTKQDWMNWLLGFVLTPLPELLFWYCYAQVGSSELFPPCSIGYTKSLVIRQLVGYTLTALLNCVAFGMNIHIHICKRRQRRTLVSTRILHSLKVGWVGVYLFLIASEEMSTAGDSMTA